MGRLLKNSNERSSFAVTVAAVRMPVLCRKRLSFRTRRKGNFLRREMIIGYFESRIHRYDSWIGLSSLGRRARRFLGTTNVDEIDDEMLTPENFVLELLEIVTLRPRLIAVMDARWGHPQGAKLDADLSGY